MVTSIAQNLQKIITVPYEKAKATYESVKTTKNNIQERISNIWEKTKILFNDVSKKTYDLGLAVTNKLSIIATQSLKLIYCTACFTINRVNQAYTQIFLEIPKNSY